MTSIVDLRGDLDGRAGGVALIGAARPLAPDLEPGTVVVADRLLSPDGTVTTVRLESAPLLAGALLRRGIPARTGAVLTGDHSGAPPFADGAIAVDLESEGMPDLTPGEPLAFLRVVVGDDSNSARFGPLYGGESRTIDDSPIVRDVLDAALPALDSWVAAIRQRTVLLAGPRSFCAGVERAIETVERALALHGAPVYVRRQIVHNRHVVEDLESRGAVFVHELNEVPEGATVVFSAHGVAPAVRVEAEQRRLWTIDATCPLVAKVHRDLHRFRDKGYQVVLIGHAGHDETEGTLGEDDDVVLVEDPGDVVDLEVRDPDKLAYVTQTTLSPEDVSSVVGALSDRFPNVQGPHAADICYATHNRQEGVRAIAPACDLVLVVGSVNSSNTARLVEVAQRAGSRAEMIDDEMGIDLEWLIGAGTVGVTAGASAPPALVSQVVSALSGLGPLVVEERSVRAENVTFPLPQEVR